jgi:hypothetical protein
MSRQFTLVVAAAVTGIVAAIFYSELTLELVADKAPVVLAVFMAALFVRLARGVPTFPFEKISQQRAETVLTALGHLRGMYGHAFLAFTVALVVSVAYTPLITTTEDVTLHSLLTGALVFTLLWALATAYLIYRTDIALFRAQTEAVQEVVSDIAASAAETSAEKVRKSLRPGVLPSTDGNSPT